MAYIENASADLGCVSIKVIEAGKMLLILITWILRELKSAIHRCRESRSYL
jgi:hypothetical protein